MDRLRSAVEAHVRRFAGFGVLAIAVVVATLSGHSRMALDATAILLTLETLILWRMSEARAIPFGRMEAWLPLDGQDGRHRARIKALFAEACRAYSRRLAAAAAIAWAADIAARLSF